MISTRHLLSGSLLSLAVAVAAVIPPLGAAENSEFARQFLGHVNLDTPGLRETKALTVQGEDAAALAAWRDYTVYRLRALPLGEFGWHMNSTYPVNLKAAEALADRPALTPDEAATLFCGAGMAALYLKTGRPEICQRYLDFVGQAATDGAIVNSASWGQVAYAVRGLGAFAKLLPDDQPREGDFPQQWQTVLALRNGTVTPAGMVLFQPETLARIAQAVALEWPDSPRGLAMFAKSGRVPNQRLGGLESLLFAAVAFDSLKRAPDLQRAVGNAILDVATGAFHVDGGNLEQSFNYNFGDAKALSGLAALYPEPRPAWCREVEATVARFDVLMAALTTPWGGLPRVGNFAGANVPALWLGPNVRDPWYEGLLKGSSSLGTDQVRDSLSRRIITHLAAPGQHAPVPFTSVAYPYSGYYVLREGWSWDSPYAFFMGARPGRGHSQRDRNGVQLAAFGRRLIVAAGPATYGFGSMPDPVRRYFDEDSWYKCNTVLVDGQGQTQVDGVAAEAYRQPIPLRWHTSEAVDLVEGIHDSGYGENFHLYKKGRQAIDTSVQHLRQLLFLRGDIPLWLVTDRMLAKPAVDQAPRQYTQIWHFPPPAAAGFSREQVVVDEAARMVCTADPAGPNLVLRHFAFQPLHYSTHWGKEDEPALGWYAHGLGDQRQPAVDLHVTWEGAEEQPVVTVLAPVRPGENPAREWLNISADGVSGFRIVLADGRVVHYLAAGRATELRVPHAAATATALFTVTNAKEELLHGLALDCQALTVAGKAVALPAADVQFEGNAVSRRRGGWGNLLRRFRHPPAAQCKPIFKRLVPEIAPTATAYADFSLAVPVNLRSPQPNLRIHYTLDGSEPTLASPVYRKPIEITAPAVLKARLATGRWLYPDIATETYVHLAPADMRDPETVAHPLENGLNYAYYEAVPNDNDGWKRLNEQLRLGLAPTSSGDLAYFSTEPWKRRGRTATVFSGYFAVPRDGLYRFVVKGGGLALHIHNPERETAAPISIAASRPGETEVAGEMALRAGLHRLRLEYSYYWGPTLPEWPVDIEGPGISRQPLPEKWLWRERDFK